MTQESFVGGMTAAERRRRSAEREHVETQDKLADLVDEQQRTNANLDVLKKNAIQTNEKLDALVASAAKTNEKLDAVIGKLDDVVTLLLENK